MTRCALYARYSSTNQNDSSLEQQVRLMRDRATLEGWEVAEVYTDAAMSGSSMIRPGLQAMLAAAQDRRFDIVLSESIDRLSRDMEDIAHMHKRFRWLGIQLITLIEGEISELHVGLKGTMSALYLRDLARRTHRGLQQRALEGESAGGRCYGYKIEPRHDAKGKRIGGRRSINPAESPHIERIFVDYVKKRKSPRKIAFEMNAEGIPGPNGGTWSSSTLYGNWRRMTASF
jgi:site-specific DNA recombinase